MAPPSTPVTVGIDVAKGQLDVAVHLARTTFAGEVLAAEDPLEVLV
jgi:hypothetical protein